MATGKVVQVIGTVVDLEFPPHELPAIYNAIEIDGDDGKMVLEVQEHFGNNWVRCLSLSPTEGLGRGTEAVDTGASLSVPVGRATLGRLFDVLGKPLDDLGDVKSEERWPIHRAAPTIEEQETTTEILETGLKIIRAIVSGERDPKKLAAYRHKQCKNSAEIIEKSLTGSYREEHIFALTQALDLYDFYNQQIIACDQAIEQQLSAFDTRILDGTPATEVKAKKSTSHCKNMFSFDARSHLKRICGVDLTAIPGIEASSALKIVSEIGLDLSRWKTSKQFASWLGLCPGNKVSGGKILSGKSKRCANNASSILRMAASALHGSDSALGAYFRRLKSRLGAPKATTAAAHKLSAVIYNMLKDGAEYRELGGDYYEKEYRKSIVSNLSRKAKKLGFELTEMPEFSSA